MSGLARRGRKYGGPAAGSSLVHTWMYWGLVHMELCSKLRVRRGSSSRWDALTVRAALTILQWERESFLSDSVIFTQAISSQVQNDLLGTRCLQRRFTCPREWFLKNQFHNLGNCINCIVFLLNKRTHLLFKSSPLIVLVANNHSLVRVNWQFTLWSIISSFGGSQNEVLASFCNSISWESQPQEHDSDPGVKYVACERRVLWEGPCGWSAAYRAGTAETWGPGIGKLLVQGGLAYLFLIGWRS